MPSSFFSRRHGSSSNPFGSSSSVRRTASPFNSDEEQDDYPYPPYGSRRNAHNSSSRSSAQGSRHNSYNEPDDYPYPPYGSRGGRHGSSHGRRVDHHGRGSLVALEEDPRRTPSFRIPTQETQHRDYNLARNSSMRGAFDPRALDLGSRSSSSRNRRLMLMLRDGSTSAESTLDDNNDSEATLVNLPTRRPPMGFQVVGPHGFHGAAPFGIQGMLPYRASPLRHSGAENRNTRRASSSHDCSLRDCDHPNELSSRRISQNPFSNSGAGPSFRRW